MLGIDTTIEAHGLEFNYGDQVDSFFICFLFNALDIPRRFSNAFEMATSNPTLWLMIAKSTRVLYDLVQEKLLVSEFEPDDNLPFHRLYCYNYGRSGAASKEVLTSMLSAKAKPTSTNELSAKYSDPAHIQRSNVWTNDLKKALSPSTMVAEGRIQNTTVEKVIVLYRKAAGCVLCGGEAKGFVGTTVGWPTSILYIANTCETHQATAKEHPSILHFIFDLFQLGLDIGTILKTESVPDNVVSILSQIIEEELCVKSIGTTKKGPQTTITFQRNSGFKVILRLKTLMDYGYMLDAPDGKSFKRIDSAPDHPNIRFFPDHIHLSPKKDNSNVISSFTYGFPLLDLPVIKRLLLEGEEEYAKK